MMVKKTSPNPLIPKLGGTDVIGQKPLIKGVNNNIVYAGGVLLVLGVGFIASNPALLGSLMGRPPGPPAAVQVTPPSVQPGQAVTIQGMFSPPVGQAWYVVTNSQGQQVASGSLGNNVSQFSQQIPATNLPSGSYTVTVSDSAPGTGTPGPTGTVGPQGPGQVFPTQATLQQGLTGGGQLGPAQSGPESISLT